jgi:hypothetical protein
MKQKINPCPIEQLFPLKQKENLKTSIPHIAYMLLVSILYEEELELP